MYKYRVAFIINGKQLNAWFVSPEKYSDEIDSRKRFREKAVFAVQEYLRNVRSVPSNGVPEALAVWPEILPVEGIVQPLDAFEINK